MKSFFILILTCGLSQAAFAKVPYTSLEKLRTFTVAVRVSIDNPDSALNKKCGIRVEDFAQLGAELSLLTDNNKAEWSKNKIDSSDLPLLKKRITDCIQRGSCSIYIDFLQSTQISDENTKKQLSEIQSLLEDKLSHLKSASYVKALASVKNPCSPLTQLLK